MLPLINTAYMPVTTQPSLVATTIPENNTLRVPHNNVTPPVSSAQVDPNASGNNKLLAQPAAQTPAASTAAATPAVTTNLSPATPIGAPATLLAQMIGQTLPPEAQQVLRGVLNEYEKVIINSYVKYKPSNASLPRAEPAGAFSQLVKQTAPAQEKPATARSTSATASPGAVNKNGSDNSEQPVTNVQAETPVQNPAPEATSTDPVNPAPDARASVDETATAS
jgi:hypothetical protein